MSGDKPPPYTTLDRQQPSGPGYYPSATQANAQTVTVVQPGKTGYNYYPAESQTNTVVTSGPHGQVQQVRQTTTTVTTVPTSTVVVVGSNCPYCGIGQIQENISIAAIIIAILCFPIGLLALLCITEKRCSHCGVNF